MSIIDWLDLSSVIARFICLLASPVFACASIYAWHKDNKLNSIHLMAWAIYIHQIWSN